MRQLENLSKLQIAKILNGKKESEIRGRDKELIKELRKKMKKNREESNKHIDKYLENCNQPILKNDVGWLIWV